MSVPSPPEFGASGQRSGATHHSSEQHVKTTTTSHSGSMPVAYLPELQLLTCRSVLMATVVLLRRGGSDGSAHGCGMSA